MPKEKYIKVRGITQVVYVAITSMPNRIATIDHLIIYSNKKITHL